MSFAREQQAKMVRTALSSGSDESVKEGLFVYNTRRGGARGSEGLPSDANLIAPHPSPGVRHASGARRPHVATLSLIDNLQSFLYRFP